MLLPPDGGIERTETEKFRLFSDHTGSLLKRQPRAEGNCIAMQRNLFHQAEHA